MIERGLWSSRCRATTNGVRMFVVLLSAGSLGLLSHRPAAFRTACLRSRPIRAVDLSARPQDESVVEQLGGGIE